MHVHHVHPLQSIFFEFICTKKTHKKSELWLHPPTHFRVLSDFWIFLTWQDPYRYYHDINQNIFLQQHKSDYFYVYNI